MDGPQLLLHGRDSWNQFVRQNNGSFLQSWEWGEFQQAFGRPVHRFFYAGGKWLGFAHGKDGQMTNDRECASGLIQFIEMPLVLGVRYWYAPRGPILQNSKVKDQHVKSGFKTQHAFESIKRVVPGDIVFVRLEPPWVKDRFAVPASWQRIGAVQPQENWVLELAPTEKDLLGAMHPKTRYNIGLAESKCTVRRSGKSNADIEAFLRLTADTSGRHAIRPHPAAYYRLMLNMPAAELWQAEHEQTIIASHIVIFFGNRVTYLHGSSSYAHRALMAPYALHWATIRQAQRRGLSAYDFGGVDETRWPGLTRFKKGFGGKEEAYVGTFDSVLRPIWYHLYHITRAVTVS